MDMDLLMTMALVFTLNRDLIVKLQHGVENLCGDIKEAARKAGIVIDEKIDDLFAQPYKGVALKIMSCFALSIPEGRITSNEIKDIKKYILPTELLGAVNQTRAQMEAKIDQVGFFTPKSENASINSKVKSITQEFKGYREASQAEPNSLPTKEVYSMVAIEIIYKRLLEKLLSRADSENEDEAKFRQILTKSLSAFSENIVSCSGIAKPSDGMHNSIVGIIDAIDKNTENNNTSIALTKLENRLGELSELSNYAIAKYVSPDAIKDNHNFATTLEMSKGQLGMKHTPAWCRILPQLSWNGKKWGGYDLVGQKSGQTEMNNTVLKGEIVKFMTFQEKFSTGIPVQQLLQEVDQSGLLMTVGEKNTDDLGINKAYHSAQKALILAQSISYSLNHMDKKLSKAKDQVYAGQLLKSLIDYSQKQQRGLWNSHKELKNHKIILSKAYIKKNLAKFSNEEDFTVVHRIETKNDIVKIDSTSNVPIIKTLHTLNDMNDEVHTACDHYNGSVSQIESSLKLSSFDKSIALYLFHHPDLYEGVKHSLKATVVDSIELMKHLSVTSFDVDVAVSDQVNKKVGEKFNFEPYALREPKDWDALCQQINRLKNTSEEVGVLADKLEKITNPQVKKSTNEAQELPVSQQVVKEMQRIKGEYSAELLAEQYLSGVPSNQSTGRLILKDKIIKTISQLMLLEKYGTASEEHYKNKMEKIEKEIRLIGLEKETIGAIQKKLPQPLDFYKMEGEELNRIDQIKSLLSAINNKKMDQHRKGMYLQFKSAQNSLQESKWDFTQSEKTSSYLEVYFEYNLKFDLSKLKNYYDCEQLKKEMERIQCVINRSVNKQAFTEEHEGIKKIIELNNEILLARNEFIVGYEEKLDNHEKKSDDKYELNSVDSFSELQSKKNADSESVIHDNRESFNGGLSTPVNQAQDDLKLTRFKQVYLALCTANKINFGKHRWNANELDVLTSPMLKAYIAKNSNSFSAKAWNSVEGLQAGELGLMSDEAKNRVFHKVHTLAKGCTLFSKTNVRSNDSIAQLHEHSGGRTKAILAAFGSSM